MLEKKLNLSEGSKNYYEENDIYEIFSVAEDYPDKIYDYLLPKIKGKTVLDLGCGTGKYLGKFYKETMKYYGLDISEKQIGLAKKKVNSKGVEFICSSAENIPIEDKQVDVIIATWVLGTVLDIDRRNKILAEIQRVLKSNGEIYLVENDIGGNFETIRGRYPNIERTEKYNKWILEHGFTIDTQFDTYFQFDSKEKAQYVFGNIWGNEVLEHIESNIIMHKIVIYKKVI